MVWGGCCTAFAEWVSPTALRCAVEDAEGLMKWLYDSFVQEEAVIEDVAER